ncbi:NFAT activation molecule 1 isoform 2-T2 [Fundulus diaphanus]
MEAQHVCRHSLTWSWIFLFSFLSACTGVTAQEIKLNSMVFVAFLGEDLTLEVTEHNPTNQTEDELRCYDPSHSQIDIFHINPTQREKPLRLLLKNMNHSGKYTCKYLKAEVKWFLRVTDKFHVKSQMVDYREIIIVGLFTGVLLVFSVLVSVCVFRGHWIETSSDSLVRSRKQKERREEKKETENEEDNMDMTTAQSSSFYASLEPRTRSIYDVLDHSAAKSDEQQTKTKSPETELSKEVKQTPEHQDEGIFESVYENF